MTISYHCQVLFIIYFVTTSQVRLAVLDTYKLREVRAEIIDIG
jgi:hypothetical protein